MKADVRLPNGETIPLQDFYADEDHALEAAQALYGEGVEIVNPQYPCFRCCNWFAPEDLDEEHHCGPCSEIDQTEAVAKLVNALVRQFHDLQQETVQAMADAATEMGHDGVSLQIQFPFDPKGAMDYLIAKGLYVTQDLRLDSDEEATIARPYNGHEVPSFRARPRRGWVLMEEE